jgi:uncharacterized repeat protein (TIGR03833 family)
VNGNNFDNPKPPKRSEIKPGDFVWVIEKKNYGTKNYTQGFIKEVLSPGASHSRGIKVRLKNGIIGRVQWKITDW